MNMKSDIEKLLQKQMDRKDFLRHVAIGFAAIAGITTVAKTLSTLSGDKSQSMGYGSSAYGGGSQKASDPRKQA